MQLNSLITNSSKGEILSEKKWFNVPASHYPCSFRTYTLTDIREGLCFSSGKKLCAESSANDSWIPFSLWRRETSRSCARWRWETGNITEVWTDSTTQNRPSLWSKRHSLRVMHRTSDNIALSHLKMTREIAASEEAHFNGQDYVCRNNGSPGNPPPH